MNIIEFIALIFAIICGAIFSSVETAIVAIPESKLISLSRNSLWARYALLLKQELQKVLIFNLFGNSLANAALTTFSTAMFVEALGKSSSMMLTIITLVVTFIIIIFSEATPKVVASKSPTFVLKFLIIPVYYLFIITKPIIWLIDMIVLFITKIFGFKSVDKISLDEIRTLVLDNNTPFGETHRRIVKNTIDFESLIIKDAVIPLRNVEMIDINDDSQYNLQKLKSSRYSSVVVYSKSIDDIIGYIKVRDILALDITNDNCVELDKLIRPIRYLQDFLPIINCLTQMQSSQELISVVVNEYGNILGVVTVIDMVESVFGKFNNNTSVTRYLLIKDSEGVYTVDGSILVRELNERLNLAIPISFSALSLNGFLLKQLKLIPNSNFCIKFNRVVFEIIQTNSYGIEKVRLYCHDKLI